MNVGELEVVDALAASGPSHATNKSDAATAIVLVDDRDMCNDMSFVS